MRSPNDRANKLALALFALAAAGPARAAEAPGAGDRPPTDALIDHAPYDALGYAVAGDTGGSTVSAAHATLPPTSYVEVTALDSGRTVLVRIERRSASSSDQLIELSPGAIAQLGLNPARAAPVRVRLVKPDDPDRVRLRAGRPAPLRLDAPCGLLLALQRKFAMQPGGLPAPYGAATKCAPPPKPVQAPVEPPAPANPAAPPPPTTATPAVPVRHGFAVQIGAFAVEANARAAVRATGGQASLSGRLWVVRMGPYATRPEAQAALGRARAAGFADAVIRRLD